MLALFLSRSLTLVDDRCRDAGNSVLSKLSTNLTSLTSYCCSWPSSQLTLAIGLYVCGPRVQNCLADWCRRDVRTKVKSRTVGEVEEEERKSYQASCLRFSQDFKHDASIHNRQHTCASTQLNARVRDLRRCVEQKTFITTSKPAVNHSFTVCKLP
jgi:hypothetical protein